jgi:segregation and condensation protein A
VNAQPVLPAGLSQAGLTRDVVSEELDDLPEQWDLPSEPDPLVIDGRFQVNLDNFSGPFDLLLTLIGRRQLDVTEVALSQVTDDFISYLATAGDEFDLGQATEFLVVAATLLDLKAARLLPAADVENEEDLALLEARDLLFARLLQYRAYKHVAGYLAELERMAGRRFPRRAELEPRFADLTPDLQIGVDLRQFAVLAAAALQPKPEPVLTIDHVHAPRVSVGEHMVVMADRLARVGSATFRVLIADCTSTLEVVARFLGLLELYRDGAVGFDQAAALSELRVRWTGGSSDAGDATDVGRSRADSTDPDEEYE